MVIDNSVAETAGGCGVNSPDPDLLKKVSRLVEDIFNRRVGGNIPLDEVKTVITFGWGPDYITSLGYPTMKDEGDDWMAAYPVWLGNTEVSWALLPGGEKQELVIDNGKIQRFFDIDQAGTIIKIEDYPGREARGGE